MSKEKCIHCYLQEQSNKPSRVPQGPVRHPTIELDNVSLTSPQSSLPMHACLPHPTLEPALPHQGLSLSTRLISSLVRVSFSCALMRTISALICVKPRQARTPQQNTKAHSGSFSKNKSHKVTQLTKTTSHACTKTS